jgi:23S rRNA (uracil1939-C5)-methyltransferase
VNAVVLPAGCVSRCRACPDRALGAEASESGKLAWLRRALGPWAERLAPVRGLPESRRWEYRERTLLAVRHVGGEWRAGLWRGRGRDAEFVPIPDCPVHSPVTRARVRAALAALPAGRPEFPASHLAVAGELVTLVIKAKPEQTEWRWAEPMRGAGAIGGAWVHWNPSAGDRVFTARGWEHAWGTRNARLRVPGWPGEWEHGPQSFLQLVPELYGEALSAAREFLEPRPGDSVLDLCAGVGVSTGGWLERGAQALAVELGGEAIGCLERNLASSRGWRALRGRCADRLPQLDEAWDAVEPARRLAYVNPPRLGLEPEVTSWLAGRGRPRRLAYLSCSAGTLARDLAAFSEAGYAVAALRPFDFFPQTRHIETLALLERKVSGRPGG